MAKLLCGVGLNDVDYKVNPIINGKHVMCPFYKAWQSMITRCYSKIYQAKKPSYIGCVVCDEWLTFSNFRGWMRSQDWQGMQLDKDILFAENKTYSPETCVFVSSMTNSFINENKAARGCTMIGVNFHSRDHVYQARCSNPFTKKSDFLGYFDDELSAHLAWKKRKLELAIIMAEKQSDKRVAEALVKRYQ